MENHIIELDKYNIKAWKFSTEILALMQKAQGSSETRPVIVTLQIGNTRWVLNSDTCGNIGG